MIALHLFRQFSSLGGGVSTCVTTPEPSFYHKIIMPNVTAYVTDLEKAEQSNDFIDFMTK